MAQAEEDDERDRDSQGDPQDSVAPRRRRASLLRVASGPAIAVSIAVLVILIGGLVELARVADDEARADQYNRLRSEAESLVACVDSLDATGRELVAAPQPADGPRVAAEFERTLNECRTQAELLASELGDAAPVQDQAGAVIGASDWWLNALPSIIRSPIAIRPSISDKELDERRQAVVAADRGLNSKINALATELRSRRRAALTLCIVALLIVPLGIALLWLASRRRLRADLADLQRAVVALAEGELDSPVAKPRFIELEQIGAQLEQTRQKMAEDAKQISILQGMSAELIHAETIQDVSDVVHRSLQDLIDPNSFGIFIRSRGELECVAVSTLSAPNFREYIGMKTGPGSLMWSAMEARETLVSINPTSDERIAAENQKVNEELGVTAYIAVPLVLLQRVIGILALTWTHPVELSTIELSTIELTGAHVALAVDRIRHAERTTESSARDRAILYSLGEGLVTSNSAGHVVNWNRTMELMTGRSEEWARGKSAFEAVHLARADATELPRSENPFVAALRDRERVTSPGDGLLLEREGEWLPVVVTVSPITEGSKLYGAVAVLRDIRRERELDELRDSLISTVSHELRTPLTMVQGFAELLSDEKLSVDDQRLAVTQIAVASQRLGELIDDVLSAAAIESGRLELFSEIVSVRETAERAKHSFPPGDAERVAVEVDPEIILSADPDRLEQILTNLMGNALKYSPRGGPVIVRASRDDGNVSITVADQGIGISLEEQASLFSKFYRAHNDEVRHIPGTGLGLYICDRLAELHGGAIDVDSEKGVGTTFTVSMPVDGPPTERESAPSSSIFATGAAGVGEVAEIGGGNE